VNGVSAAKYQNQITTIEAVKIGLGKRAPLIATSRLHPTNHIRNVASLLEKFIGIQNTNCQRRRNRFHSSFSSQMSQICDGSANLAIRAVFPPRE